MGTETTPKNTQDSKTKTDSESDGSNLKAIAKNIMFLIIVYEAIRFTLVKCVPADKQFVFSITVAGSVLALLVYFLLHLCLDTVKYPKLKAVKEFVFLVSTISFTLIVQHFHFENQTTAMNFLEMNAQSLSVYNLLIIFLYMQRFLDLSPITSMITVLSYFLFTYLKTFQIGHRPDYKATLNIISPGIILILLIGMEMVVYRKNQKTNKNPQEANSSAQNMSSDLISIILQGDGSAVTYNREGELKFINQTCFQNMDYASEEEALSRVTGLVQISDKNISNEKRFEDVLARNPKKMKLNVDTPNKKTAYQKLTINVGTDPLSDLASLLRSTFAAAASKAPDESKVIEYEGKIEKEKQNTTILQIMVYVFPSHRYPVITTMKDITQKKEYEELKAFEANRETLLKLTKQHIYRALELSKAAVNTSGQIISTLSLPTKGEPKQTEIWKQPLNLSLNMICRLIDDYSAFSKSRRTEIKLKNATCNIKKTIEGIIHLFQAEARYKKVKLIFYCQDSVGEYSTKTDQERLSQLLIELIKNALKCTSDNTVVISLNNYNDSHKISVDDNGTGIEKEVLTQINDELKLYESNLKGLFSAKSPMKGLVYANILAKALGSRQLGGLNIKSTVGEGTSVGFLINNKEIDNDSKMKLDKSGVSIRSNHMRNTFKVIRSSNFKMSHECDNRDSISDLGESFGIGAMTNKILENSPKRMPSPLRSPAGVFSFQTREHSDYADTNRMESFQLLASPSQLSITVREEHIVVLSEDAPEAEKIMKTCKMEGFICTVVTSVTDLESEIKNKNEKLSLVIIDAQMDSSPDFLKNVIQNLRQKYKGNGFSAPMIGLTKDLTDLDLTSPRLLDQSADQRLLVNDLIDKPLNQHKVQKLIRNHCRRLRISF